MKAVQVNSYGGVEVLEINENTPIPTPQKGQVLVEVHAASINPIDWKVRTGYLKEMVPLQFPATLGGDFSGRAPKVEEIVYLQTSKGSKDKVKAALKEAITYLSPADHQLRQPAVLK